MAVEIGPTRLKERIVSLDELRGFAVLGILIMNIQNFSMIGAAYFNPTAYGDLSGPNYGVWLLSHLLADMKFLTIFSMLFGSGIVLMAERMEARGQPPTYLHYRRMAILLLVGLAHVSRRRPALPLCLSGIARTNGISTTQIRSGELPKAVGGSRMGCIFQT